MSSRTTIVAVADPGETSLISMPSCWLARSPAYMDSAQRRAVSTGSTGSASHPGSETQRMTQERRLVLVRHAKTEQGAPDVSRALTERGRRDRREIGRWLAANDVVPDAVIESPPGRTRQTWQVAAEQLAATPPVNADQRIYDNSVSDVLAVARDTDDSVQTLAIVGHNPSMHGVAIGLLGGDGEAAAGQLREFPTATVAVFTVDGGWEDVGRLAASLAAITTCRG